MEYQKSLIGRLIFQKSKAVKSEKARNITAHLVCTCLSRFRFLLVIVKNLFLNNFQKWVLKMDFEVRDQKFSFPVFELPCVLQTV